MNKELIKWMIETRENLTFDNKVQLIKNFWDNKETFGKFIRKYHKNSLEEVEQLIESKFQEISQEKTHKNNLETHSNFLLTNDLSIPTIKHLHSQLLPHFHNLQLPNTWNYLNTLAQDYFNTIDNLETIEKEETLIPEGSTAQIELQKALELVNQLKDQNKEIKLQLNQSITQNETLISRIMEMDYKKKKPSKSSI